MDKYFRALLLLILAGAIVIPAGQICAQAQNPPQKKAADQKQAETDQEYTEEEYNAMEAARTEKDPQKQAALVIAFLDKYPKSKLRPYVVNVYETLMYQTLKAGENQRLLQLAEQWLKYHPNDLKSQAYIFDAAAALGQHQKVVEYGEKLYAQQQNVKLALPIYSAYDKLGNAAKREEWSLKLLQYPEYANDIQLRMQLVADYAEKDLPKSAMYAEQVLKAIPNAQKPASTSEAEWKKALTSVKKTCLDIIGMNLFTQKKYGDAINALTKANEAYCKHIVAEKYDSAFYYIGQSQWQMGQAEEAADTFAVAALIGGKLAAKADKNSRDLYKSQRNGTEVGYDKVERRAKATLEALQKCPG